MPANETLWSHDPHWWLLDMIMLSVLGVVMAAVVRWRIRLRAARQMGPETSRMYSRTDEHHLPRLGSTSQRLEKLGRTVHADSVPANRSRELRPRVRVGAGRLGHSSVAPTSGAYISEPKTPSSLVAVNAPKATTDGGAQRARSV